MSAARRAQRARAGRPRAVHARAADQMELEEELVVVAALWHALGRESLNALADALMPAYTLLVVALISVVANREHQDRKAAAENASRGVAKAPPERAPLAATPINAQPERAWLVEDGDFSRQSGARPNLTGTWKLTRNENLQSFLTELGLRLIARQGSWTRPRRRTRSCTRATPSA